MIDDVPDLRGGASKTFLFFLGPILGALGVFAGMVWSAARYPDRTEFNALTERARVMEQNIAVTGVRVENIQKDTGKLGEQMQRIETKLDKKIR